MKKILNKPDHFVDEMVEGILLAHPSLRRGANLGRMPKSGQGFSL